MSRNFNESNVDVKNEALLLLKEGNLSADKMATLRKRFPNTTTVEQIQDAFYEASKELNKNVRKFAKKIRKTYGSQNVPLTTIMSRARDFKEAQKMSDLEFSIFRQEYEKQTSTRASERYMGTSTPSTIMYKVFGEPDSNDGLNLNDGDYGIVKQIMELYTASRSTQQGVFMQSLNYTGINDQLVSQAIFDSSRDNLTHAVDPVVVAMFAPKIKAFEDRFLYTSLARIVTARNNKERLNEWEIDMLHSIVHDHIDVVCSDKSAMADIRGRANLQNALWNTVLNMRTGKFFHATNADFSRAVDKCSAFRHNTPDIIYGGDENVVLQRLLTAMAYNSFVVETSPIFGVNGVENYGGFPVLQNTYSLQSMATVRLPVKSVFNNYDYVTSPAEAVDLETAISGANTFNELNQNVIKNQRIQMAHGAIVFCIPRRMNTKNIPFSGVIRREVTFSSLPIQLTMNERLNMHPVTFNPIMGVADKGFQLASAVILERFPGQLPGENPNPRDDNIIMGSAAIVAESIDGMAATSAYKIYSPSFIMQNEPVNTAISSTHRAVWQSLGDAEELMRTQASIIIFRDISA